MDDIGASDPTPANPRSDDGRHDSAILHGQYKFPIHDNKIDTKEFRTGSIVALSSVPIALHRRVITGYSDRCGGCVLPDLMRTSRHLRSACLLLESSTVHHQNWQAGNLLSVSRHLSFSSRGIQRPDDESRSRNRDSFRFRKDPSRKSTRNDRTTGGIVRKTNFTTVTFETLVTKALDEAEQILCRAPIVDHLSKDGLTFKDTFHNYKATIVPGFGKDRGIKVDKDFVAALKSTLTDTRSQTRLLRAITIGYYDHVTNIRFAASDQQHQKAVADCRFPSEWFPQARALQRKIHLHVGPTNSGKTYHALKSLEAAPTGMYAGPLRLLAHEVYSRLNYAGRACSLVTGEERRLPNIDYERESPMMESCTVEMANLNQVWDVAVIDEIQMLGSVDRGWAWTRALLGLQAKELHLCGEKRTVPLIRKLLASVGEVPIVHEYERLSPLKLDDKSLSGKLENLRKGDCVVSFSVMGIHALRNAIEAKTGRKVAIVYGSLPPETRAQQARLFNDPDSDYDFLVASDAIGMGLNLSIKRIIFETVVKFDGQHRRLIDVADIKQIAGRAGRYKAASLNAPASADVASVKGETAEHVNIVSESHLSDPSDSMMDLSRRILPNPPTSYYAMATGTIPGTAAQRKLPPNDPSNFGLVTTLETADYPAVQRALEREPEPILTAGLLPSDDLISRFSQYFPPGTPFSYMLTRLNTLAEVGTGFHICTPRDALWIADLIEPCRKLTIMERNAICNAPCGERDKEIFDLLLPALARCIEEQRGGALFDILEIPLELLETEVVYDRSHLAQLEQLHKALVVYLWLSYRFAGVFGTRALALDTKRRVEDRIERVLEAISTETMRQRIVQARRKTVETLERQRENEQVDVGPFATKPAQSEDAQSDAEVLSDVSGVDVSAHDEPLQEPSTNGHRSVDAGPI